MRPEFVGTPPVFFRQPETCINRKPIRRIHLPIGFVIERNSELRERFLVSLRPSWAESTTVPSQSKSRVEISKRELYSQRKSMKTPLPSESEEAHWDRFSRTPCAIFRWAIRRNSVRSNCEDRVTARSKSAQAKAPALARETGQESHRLASALMFHSPSRR